jgi:hypothetical protein
MIDGTPPLQVILPDGEVAWVRRLDAGDAAAVRALRDRFSGSDRHLWFFGVDTTRLTELASQLSGGRGAGHTAVGCFRPSGLAGVACYDVLPDSAEAEVMLVVGERSAPALGIASLLLDQLVVSAQHEGVRTFVTDAREEDAKLLEEFTALGIPLLTRG